MAVGRVMLVGLFGLMWSSVLRAAEHVIAISVDGLGTSYLESVISAGRAPNFERLQRESAWTGDGRTDYDYTVTLPNHVSMITGRPVLNKLGSSTTGHLWTANTEPGTATLHSNRGFYVSSVFDVVHDSGGRTGLYVTKNRLRLFDQSYDGVNGAPHPAYGRDKIDTYLFGTSAAITGSFVSAAQSSPFRFAMLHYADPDNAGHQFGWGSVQFNDAVVAVDGYLGTLFDLVDNDPVLRGRTSIILTADHGGTGMDHGDPADPLSYTVPFFVWGVGVTRGVNLYALNSRTRTNGGERVDYGASIVPIRTGDVANLALAMLGLSAVPGSSINAGQDLVVSAVPGDANLDGVVNIADLGILAANWQQSDVGWQGGDFTQNGTVDIADLGILAANWQVGAGASLVEEWKTPSGTGGAMIPEPIGGVGALIGGIAGMMRRWR